MKPEAIEAEIRRAAETVAPVWPLHSFVTANPLAGFEDRPFHEAVARGRSTFGGDGYPNPDLFRRALADGRIDRATLEEELVACGYDSTPEATLKAMTAASPESGSLQDGATDRVDAVVTKWLAAFLDEGRAAWPMPDREEGFYRAFRSVARHDREIPDREAIESLPDDPIDAIREVFNDADGGTDPDRLRSIFEHQLTALPGWTGLVKQRIASGDAWQSAAPITLAGYLAVRLTLADLFGASLVESPPEETVEKTETAKRSIDGDLPPEEAWLRAWERSYRSELIRALTTASAALGNESQDADRRPDAQLVFCIDTRSEIIRRHVEAVGEYETHGYAGFFGIPMRFAGYGSSATVDSCPPIIDAQHHVTDRPVEGADGPRAEYDRWRAVRAAGSGAIERLRDNAATAFNFVESAGVGYATGLAARTLFPARLRDLVGAIGARIPDEHEFLGVDVGGGNDPASGMSREQKIEYAAAAFELMGWERFARVVVFLGHASDTTNNPFDASLDCGACAGHPGGPNARVLATICNDEAVRAGLHERGIEIPEDTVFVAGEHTTTTDEITLYDDGVPESHEPAVEQLKADLATARASAAAERAADMGDDPESGLRATKRRSADWAETRPEWGLAGNASLIVGPRALTADLDLDARAFLHSYNWQTDPDGEALAAILTGPMIVTQWINAQYYFATVDTAVYGSGSKVTHNPVGNVGVYQGNGGDLLTGLPEQSLTSVRGAPYHQPLRLSTVVHAPVKRVQATLSEHDGPRRLVENGWLSLTVVDPEQNHHAFRYAGDGEWEPLEGRSNRRGGTPRPR